MKKTYDQWQVQAGLKKQMEITWERAKHHMPSALQRLGSLHACLQQWFAECTHAFVNAWPMSCVRVKHNTESADLIALWHCKSFHHCAWEALTNSVIRLCITVSELFQVQNFATYAGESGLAEWAFRLNLSPVLDAC